MDCAVVEQPEAANARMAVTEGDGGAGEYDGGGKLGSGGAGLGEGGGYGGCRGGNDIGTAIAAIAMVERD